MAASLQRQKNRHEGGITYQTDQGDVRLGGRYDNSEENLLAFKESYDLRRVGVYNAKKVDMTKLEAYDV